jgi:hypothetical protein
MNFGVLAILLGCQVLIAKSEINGVSTTCNSKCLNTCLGHLSHIPNYSCRYLCSSHCRVYGDAPLTSEQTTCLVACQYTALDKSLCPARCKTEQAIQAYGSDSIERVSPQSVEEKAARAVEDVGEGCVGFGREYCYKICRLDHKESIKVCLCACCMCKF